MYVCYMYVYRVRVDVSPATPVITTKLTFFEDAKLLVSQLSCTLFQKKLVSISVSIIMEIVEIRFRLVASLTKPLE